ncbi:unnamed protein product [Rotaria sordida]|uniref:Uncharacterized protein n=1 Tax=Rotaria sordida TaxID=392033 RepID=A0A819F4S2_9BILA|nr:unnamed protein product [Rotaria sordida]
MLTDKDRKKNVQLQQQRLIVPMCFYNNKFIWYFEGSNRNISRQFSLVYQFKDDENHQHLNNKLVELYGLYDGKYPDFNISPD